jgi:hypothetical protein
LAHGRRAVEIAEERGSSFSRVEAAVFLGAAEVAAGHFDSAASALQIALDVARTRRTALWYEPRILATLAEATVGAGDRDRARALLAEASARVEGKRGWRLSACDVELARIRLLTSEPRIDRAAVEQAIASLDVLASELNADVYRAEVERIRRSIHAHD